MVPFKAGVHNMSRAVRSMPDTVLTTVDGVVDGLYRKFVKPSHPRLPSSADTHRGSFDLEVGVLVSWGVWDSFVWPY